MGNQVLKFFIAIALIACASSNKLGGPAWIFDPYAVSKNSSEIAAVGISDMTAGGIKMQIAQADNDAVNNLRAQIETKVDRIVTDVMEGSSDIKATGDKQAQVQKVEDVKKRFSAVTKSFVNGSVFGAMRTDIWQDPNTGTLYVRMAMSSTRVGEALKSSIGMFQKLGESGVDKETVKKLTDGILGIKFENQSQPQTMQGTSTDVKGTVAS